VEKYRGKDPTTTNNRQAAPKTNILKPNMKLKVGQVAHRWEGTLGGISLTADCRTRFLNRLATPRGAVSETPDKYTTLPPSAPSIR
jgi:hypothetical protein